MRTKATRLLGWASLPKSLSKSFSKKNSWHGDFKHTRRRIEDRDSGRSSWRNPAKLHFRIRETTASVVHRQGEMMKKVFSILVSCFSLALIVSTPARAQLPGTAIRATIPFDFNVRGKTLPAGKYEIRRIADSPENLMIYNAENHQTVMFETDAVESRLIFHKGEILFHRYGDSYFLYEIWTAGEDMGRELPPSRAERRLEHESASTNSKPEMVALAVN
jgi:hypothetical protein